MNGRNGSPSRAVIWAMVACKVLSLMLRQWFVIGPTLGFAATVCRLRWHVVTGLQNADYRQLGRVKCQVSSLADKHPLAYSLPAVQRSVTQSMPGYGTVTLSGCLHISLRSVSIHTFTASTNRLQLQVDRGGGCGVVFTLYSSSSPWSTSTLLHQPSNPLCMGRYLLHNCTCTVLFAVPDFPGNLAVFIPGKSGMKRSGNPGRPGNGSPGMNSLVQNTESGGFSWLSRTFLCAFSRTFQDHLCPFSMSFQDCLIEWISNKSDFHTHVLNQLACVLHSLI